MKTRNEGSKRASMMWRAISVQALTSGARGARECGAVAGAMGKCGSRALAGQRRRGWRSAAVDARPRC